MMVVCQAHSLCVGDIDHTIPCEGDACQLFINQSINAISSTPSCSIIPAKEADIDMQSIYTLCLSSFTCKEERELHLRPCGALVRRWPRTARGSALF